MAYSDQLMAQAKQLMKQAKMAKALEEVEAELAKKDGSTWQELFDGMAEKGYPLQLTYIDLEFANQLRKANL